MSVLVCIPTAGHIHARTAEAAFAICATHAGGASFRTMRAHPTDRCRNLCARGFLESPHSHMLFLDSDIVPPTDCLDAMLAVDAPIVCGICPLHLDSGLCLNIARKLDGDEEYGFLLDIPSGPFEVDAAGLGCTLIAREVFETLERPWFDFGLRDDMSNRGEDITFFENAKAAGFRAVALPQVVCSHYREVDLLPLLLECRRGERGTTVRLAA